MSMESHSGTIMTGETEELGEKPVPAPHYQSQKYTWIYPVANPSLRGGRPATNRLKHGMAKHTYNTTYNF